MSQFKDTYGILALAAITKKITPKEDTDKLGNFFGELEKILGTVSNKFRDVFPGQQSSRVLSEVRKYGIT